MTTSITEEVTVFGPDRAVDLQGCGEITVAVEGADGFSRDEHADRLSMSDDLDRGSGIDIASQVFP